MQNTYPENNGELNLFGESNTRNGTIDSDSICRNDGILRTNIHFSVPIVPKLCTNPEKCKTEVLGLMAIISYRVTQIVTFMSGN